MIVVQSKPDGHTLTRALKPFNVPVVRRVCKAVFGGDLSDYTGAGSGRQELIQRLEHYVRCTHRSGLQ